MKQGRAIALGVAVALATTSFAFAQSAGADADFNRSDREQVKRQQSLQCQRDCDTVGRVNSIACGQFGLQAAGTCNLNVQKQTAACYQTCK
jgi:hypothetical protein